MAANILFVIPSLDVGGTEIQLLLLAKRLLSTPYRPHILCLLREGELAANARKAQIPLECAGLSESLSFKTGAAVKRACRNWKIDLVHTFLFGMDLPAVKAAKSAGVAAVITSRRQIPNWKERRHIKIQKMANKKTDLVVCNSVAVRDFICDQETLPEEMTRVIYNGFPEDSIPKKPAILSRPPERTFLRPYSLAEDEVALACVANFSPVKNHARLFEALFKVLLDGLKVRLFLIGEGPNKEEMERYAADHRVGMATVFLGRRMDRLKMLSECDCLVLPSLNEGFPNAVLEACAIGVPVAASRAGGIPELVEHGKTGWLFDPKSISSIAETLSFALTQRDETVRCATAAQERVRKLFTAREMVANYERLYSELLSD